MSFTAVLSIKNKSTFSGDKLNVGFFYNTFYSGKNCKSCQCELFTYGGRIYKVFGTSPIKSELPHVERHK
jgi:hypothetical protein